MKSPALIAFYTILRREVVRVVRIWTQTLLPPVITMSLYFIIFGNLIGTRIGQMQGFPYIEYIAPGLVMLTVINSAYANVASSFFSARFQRSIEEILISPTPEIYIILGYCLGGVLRGLLVGVCVTIVASFFTGISFHHVGLTLLVAFLSALVFALMGFTNGIFARKFDDVAIVPTFILTPLTYLGGVFYSLTLLPNFWQQVSKLNPIIYMVNAYRYGLLGVSDINVNFAIAMLTLFAVLFMGLNIFLLKRGVGIRT